MLFYLHYMLMTSGLSGVSVLLAVYFRTYTDASQSEVGALLMTFPFVGLIIKPLFCSMADRHQAHRRYLIISLLIEMLGYAPFAIIPCYPAFYTQHPRLAWYLLVIGCHLGNGGLGVAWSLADCLAVNYSQKTGTPFGQMRLMGTLSWGVYGFIIGQINEIPALPKYLSAFLILHLSLMLEIGMVLLWDKSDFDMVDPLASLTGTNTPTPGQLAASEPTKAAAEHVDKPKGAAAMICDQLNSVPSSLGGTLRLRPETGSVFREVLAPDELELRLKAIESSQEQQRVEEQQKAAAGEKSNHQLTTSNEPAGGKLASLEAGLAGSKVGLALERNPQLMLLKMILSEDGRVIKYIFLFTVIGILLAPMNFLFLSMEEMCRERDYNFSQLAGAVLISQALMETLIFLVVPRCMRYVGKAGALSASLLIMSARWAFYSNWYYSTGISPYWAVVGEWAHGISYGVFTTVLADVSLMFANSSRLFIPELRKMGFLSSVETSSKEKIEAEENAIKMALRATMQALFGGFMDGLGQGAGSLLCGIFIEIYSYVTVWKMFLTISITSVLLYLLAELTKSRWSDNYEAGDGTKAREIMQLSRAYEAESRRRRKRSTRGSIGTGALSKHVDPTAAVGEGEGGEKQGVSSDRAVAVSC